MSLAAVRRRWRSLSLAPDGRPRPEAPLGRGPLAARVLARVIDAAAWGGSRVPSGVSHRVAVVGGTGEWALRAAKRRALAVNLAHAVGRPADDPRVAALVRRQIVNEAHRSADLLWALGRPDELLETTVLDGVEHAQRAAAAGRGVILAGIHVGGWEVATAVPRAVLPVPTTVIVADDWLAWAIEHMRVTAGLRILYRTEPAIRAARLLRAGEALLVLGDDGWGSDPRGLVVRFLDGYAALPAGIVSLARMTGAPIVSFYVLPVGRRRWRVLVDPAIEAPGRRDGEGGERCVLQSLADRWSDVIRTHPEHWAASYRIRWVEDGGPAI
jgi:lauroyl/myristoyl acyltransferase